MSLKKIFIGIAVIIFAIFLIGSFANSGSGSSSSASAKTEKGTEIVFFWLPSGAPCQEQDKILKSIESKKPEIKVTRLDVNQASTSTMANKYGVRTVPTIVILDENGATVKQFTPGVQTEATLNNYLK